MPNPADRRFLVFRETESRKIVHPVEVTGRSDHHIDKVERGMVMRLRDDQFVDDMTGEELVAAGWQLQLP